MSKDRDFELMRIHQEHLDAISMQIKISGEQVDYITVTSLLEKYAGILRRPKGNENTVGQFEGVLYYYLSVDEMVAIKRKLLDVNLDASEVIRVFLANA